MAKSLDRSRQVLTGLDRSWQVLTGLDRSWQVLTGLDRPWQVLTGLDRSWQVLTGLDLFSGLRAFTGDLLRCWESFDTHKMLKISYIVLVLVGTQVSDCSDLQAFLQLIFLCQKYISKGSRTKNSIKSKILHSLT